MSPIVFVHAEDPELVDVVSDLVMEALLSVSFTVFARIYSEQSTSVISTLAHNGSGVGSTTRANTTMPLL